MPRYFRNFSALAAGLSVATMTLLAPSLAAQDMGLKQKLGEIKQSAAANKAALAKYTWTQQQTISLKGEVKSTKMYQVRIGPDGKQLRTEMGAPDPPQQSGGRLRRRIVERKTEEYKEYAEKIAALARTYAQPDPQLLEQAYAQGNVSVVPSPAGLKLVVKSYLKPNDSLTLQFGPNKALTAVQVASYLTDPTDSFTVSVTYAKLPDGSNQISMIQVNGQSKQLGITLQNSNFRPM